MREPITRCCHLLPRASTFAAGTPLCLSVGIALLVASCVDDPAGRFQPEAGIGTLPDSGTNLAVLELELALGENETAPPEYLFASIQDILVLQNGTIWVLDGDGGAMGGQTPQLRQYDSEGNFLGHVGRQGSGPGEYRAPYAMALMADGRVALRDQRLPDRITLFATDGTLDTTWSLPGGLSWPFAGGLGIQVDTGGVVWLPSRARARPGPERPPSVFLRLALDGTVLSTVPFPPTPEVERDELRVTRTLPSGGTSVRGIIVPYQPRGTLAWSPFGTFAVARTDRYRIEVLPPPGVPDLGVRTVITREVPPVLVRQAERGAARKKLTERVSAVEGGSGLRVPEIPGEKPPIKYLDYSEDGRLLVSVSMPSSLLEGEWTEPNALDVFDLERKFIGRVMLPDSFQMFRMRGNHIWGVFRGVYDLESVRRYKIVWP